MLDWKFTILPFSEDTIHVENWNWNLKDDQPQDSTIKLHVCSRINSNTLILFFKLTNASSSFNVQTRWSKKCTAAKIVKFG